MAKGINKAIIVGSLGQDPEVKYTQTGAAITNISAATNESWTDKQSGQKQERTEWHRIVFFNRLAEIAGEYLRKGSQVYIEGSLRTRKWQDQQGQDRYTTEIVASEMQMLGGKSEGGQQQAPQQGGYGQQAPQQPAYNQQAPQQGNGYAQSPQQNAASHSRQAQPAAAPPMDSFDDDIPY